MVCRTLLFFSTLLFITACQSGEDQPGTKVLLPPKEEPIVVVDTTTSLDMNWFLFLEEGELEGWEVEGPNQKKLLTEIDLGNLEDFPPGKYILKEIQGRILLEFPNEYYRRKDPDLEAKSLSFKKSFENVFPEAGQEIWVFPNDPRKGKGLKSCFACPHWMAEVYGRLELVITGD